MAKKTADQIRIEVTTKMVEALKSGVRPWAKPWVNRTNSGLPMNFSNNRKYTGINPLILMFESMLKGFESRYWGTSNCWMKETGAQVKKNERASTVILFNQIPKKNKDGTQELTLGGKPKTIPIMREFPLFNVDQMMAPTIATLMGVPKPRSILSKLMDTEPEEGRTEDITPDELLKIAVRYLPAKSCPTESSSRLTIATKIHLGIAAKLNKYKSVAVIGNTDPDFAPAEALLVATGAKIKHGGDKASYTRPPADLIQLPTKRSFFSMTHYYQTAMHELAHWTESDERVGQKEGHDYAWGELVAEISSCFTLMALGVPLADKMLPKSEAYLLHWLTMMGEDPKFLFQAATWASKVSDFLLSYVGQQNLDYEEEVLREAA